MPPGASTEPVHLSGVYNTHMTLPSLKDDRSSAAPAVKMFCATSSGSNDFDDFCRRDDMLFLRLGQGTKRYRAGRNAAQDYLRFPGMPVCLESGADDDSRSIGESEYGDNGSNPVRVSNITRTFPSFSPEPIGRSQHCEREVQLGSSQRDVYDVSPPPGYKRLKRVRAPPLDIDDENMTATVAMNQLLSPPEGHINRLQRSRRRQIAISRRQDQNTKYKSHHGISGALLPMGDGFSGDETHLPQRKSKQGKRARPSRAKPAAKRARRSRDASDSSGSNQSMPLFNNTPLNSSLLERQKKKRGRGDQPLPLVGSLDVVSLSQEDMRTAHRAATAALHSAEKSKDIATHVFPLRPMAGLAASGPKEVVSLGLDEPDLGFSEEVQVQGVIDDDGQGIGDVVFDVIEGGGEDDNGAAAESLPLLPSLRF